MIVLRKVEGHKQTSLMLWDKMIVLREVEGHRPNNVRKPKNFSYIRSLMNQGLRCNVRNTKYFSYISFPL